MDSLFKPLNFKRGPSMKNRIMLAPLTNSQSQEDGVLSEDEFNWLTMRAKGGFGLTMTCAAHVQAHGKGFPGQLGVFDNKHIEGLKRLADAIKREGSVSICQLHHAGMRSPADIIKQPPVCPSDNEELGARALSKVRSKKLLRILSPLQFELSELVLMVLSCTVRMGICSANFLVKKQIEEKTSMEVA